MAGAVPRSRLLKLGVSGRRADASNTGGVSHRIAEKLATVSALRALNTIILNVPVAYAGLRHRLTTCRASSPSKKTLA